MQLSLHDFERTRSVFVLWSPRAPVAGLEAEIAAGVGAGIGATDCRRRHRSGGPAPPAAPMEFWRLSVMPRGGPGVVASPAADERSVTAGDWLLSGTTDLYNHISHAQIYLDECPPVQRKGPPQPSPLVYLADWNKTVFFGEPSIVMPQPETVSWPLADPENVISSSFDYSNYWKCRKSQRRWFYKERHFYNQFNAFIHILL